MLEQKHLKENLISRNIKPSYQRIQILKYLIKNATHPTVDEIYMALVEEMPTLSKTTVYNTLKLFVDNGLARALSIEDIEVRYDGDVRSHGHFKCMSCKKIFDFTVDMDKFLTEELKDFTIQEKNIYFKGICKKCNYKNNEEQKGGVIK
jgi:Fe2+ or Zn2+ uptake regulation protein